MALPREPFRGVLVPVLTPFTADLEPDAARFVTLCRWLLDQGADGLAIFGTTSEANSLSVDERLSLLDVLVEAGIPPDRLLPGIGSCALPDTVRLGRAAVAAGCGGVLLLPPFYYKAVDDDGLFDYFAAAIDRIGDTLLRVYLYHIPPVAQVPIRPELIARLRDAFPGIITGLKDSSGDWAHTKAILDAFPDLATFAGSEAFLLKTLRSGGAGCITATGNVNVGAIKNVVSHWQTPQADDLQATITRVRQIIQTRPTIPALKALLAAAWDEPGWATVRPPLRRLDPRATKELDEELRDAGFAIAPRTGWVSSG